MSLGRTFAVIFAVVFLGGPLALTATIGTGTLSIPDFIAGIVYGIVMIEVLYIVRRVWTGTWSEKGEDSD